MKHTRVEGKTAFDYFSEEHFKMKCEGYKYITEKQLAIYHLLGSQNYRMVTRDAFKHAYWGAVFLGIQHSDKRFGKLCRKFLDDYCSELRKKYLVIRNEDPDNENNFVYSPQSERQMWENVKNRASARFSKQTAPIQHNLISLPLS
jgi:hypothetical protein